ncbi:caspase family protein [uncultured Cohaesibacter sp.]|uniref:caspase family protein n=1 Tax=uncultured Cohaesibacter sp. TaxID=1002546 RepID=UPI0029C8F014|nr:caspase family protein [uncultured Cohaesibacter sp.]
MGVLSGGLRLQPSLLLIWGWPLLVVICLCVLVSAPAGAEERFALLIANSAYSDSIGPLDNPKNDVALLERALTQLGFQVETAIDQNKRSLMKAILAHSEKLQAAGNGAVGFLYYSGHGFSDSTSGANFILPIDVASQSDLDLELDAIRLEWIVDILQQRAGNAANFVVFDACRNKLKGFKGSKGFVPEISYSKGMLIGFATAPGDVASDQGSQGGPYARALAKQMMTPGRHEGDLFFYVAKDVIAETKGAQQPWVSNSLTDRVYFNGKVDGVERPVVSGPASLTPACEAEKQAFATTRAVAAFAVASNGTCATSQNQVSRQEAERDALEKCGLLGEHCLIDAVNEGAWELTSDRCKEALAAWKSESGIGAFAISRSGQLCGSHVGVEALELAKERALDACNKDSVDCRVIETRRGDWTPNADCKEELEVQETRQPAWAVAVARSG